MNENYSTLDDDLIWNYHHRDYKGHEIIFRQNLITGLIQMKVTNEMALANGYASLQDMNETINRDMGTIVILPEWMDIPDTAVYSNMN